MRSTLILAALLALTPPPAGRADDERAYVAGGTFLMGTSAHEVARLRSRYQVDFPSVFENEVPAHPVTVSAFRLDRHEVTNERFAEFLAANPKWRREALAAERHNGDYLADWEGDRMPAGKARHPVVFVTWHAAQAFCRWAGGRLPTEAEWEFAARAGGDREFPWGDAPPSPERANYHATAVGGTTPVGSFPANELGLNDLAGNVWEFLLDVWRDSYAPEAQIDPIAGGPVADEGLLDVAGRRAVRGASHGGSVVNLRTRWRDSHVVTNAVAFVGFRCAYPAGHR